MTQYNSLNVKLSNSQLNKLKSAIKNKTEVILRLLPNMIGDSNDETNFPHKLLLTDRQVLSICKSFVDNYSADIKFSKTKLSKMIQSGEFFWKLLGPLLKTGLPLIKSVIKPLAKCVLIPLGLAAAACKFNNEFRFLLCIIDIYSKYAWVIPLKYKKGVSIVNTFQKFLKESNHKPNKIWVEKGSEFYNNSFKKWLKDNEIEMYSTHNEGRSVVAERFIRTLKTKIYKYMTSISKNVYIDKLDDIVNEYNNTYHTSIKMKPVDVEDDMYIDSKKEVNNEYPKFKVGDYVRISKYKSIFAKG